MTATHPDSPSAATGSEPQDAAPVGRLRAWWSAFVGAIGAAVGIAPHVLHHVGLFAGSVLIAGSGGTALFGVLGLVASIPLLLKLRRRYNSWWAPAIALAVFAAMFSISAFVVGPALTGDAADPGQPQPTPSAEHSQHHQ